jgi:hypothetical protein
VAPPRRGGEQWTSNLLNEVTGILFITSSVEWNSVGYAVFILNFFGVLC